jgi:hypothetical protein
MSDAQNRENALLLIKSIRNALDRGCIHRDRAGNVLTSELAVLECLQREGSCTVQEPTNTRRR